MRSFLMYLCEILSIRHSASVRNALYVHYTLKIISKINLFINSMPFWPKTAVNSLEKCNACILEIPLISYWLFNKQNHDNRVDLLKGIWAIVYSPSCAKPVWLCVKECWMVMAIIFLFSPKEYFFIYLINNVTNSF